MYFFILKEKKKKTGIGFFLSSRLDHNNSGEISHVRKESVRLPAVCTCVYVCVSPHPQKNIYVCIYLDWITELCQQVFRPSNLSAGPPYSEAGCMQSCKSSQVSSSYADFNLSNKTFTKFFPILIKKNLYLSMTL